MGFKGSNQFELNQATMIEAIQHYFTSVMFAEGKAPTVVGVKSERNRDYGAPSFTVETREPEPAEK